MMLAYDNIVLSTDQPTFILLLNKKWLEPKETLLQNNSTEAIFLDIESENKHGMYISLSFLTVFTTMKDEGHKIHK